MPTEPFSDARARLEALDLAMAVVEFNPEGRILEANANFLDLMGYQRGQVIGRHHRMLVPPDEQRTTEYLDFWERLRSGQRASGRFRRIARGGRKVYIEATYQPVVTGGEVVKVIKLAYDVTESAVEEGRQASILTALSRTMAVLEFDTTGVIQDANPNFRHLAGYELSEIRGRHHRILLFDEDSSTPEYERFWLDLADGVPQSGRFRRRTKNGDAIQIQAAYNPIFDNGTVTGVIKLAYDTTSLPYAGLDNRHLAAIRRQARHGVDALEGVLKSIDALEHQVLDPPGE